MSKVANYGLIILTYGISYKYIYGFITMKKNLHYLFEDKQHI